MGEGPSIKMNVKTDKGKPPPLQRPVIVEDDLSDEFIPMELEIASERNGPIRYLDRFLRSSFLNNCIIKWRLAAWSIKRHPLLAASPYIEAGTEAQRSATQLRDPTQKETNRHPWHWKKSVVGWGVGGGRGSRKWLEEPRGVDIIERREFYTQMNHMIRCREDEKGIRKKRSTNTNSFQTLTQFTSLFSLSENERREEENWCRLSRILSCLNLQSRRPEGVEPKESQFIFMTILPPWSCSVMIFYVKEYSSSKHEIDAS